jgi:hypothetical protein
VEKAEQDIQSGANRCSHSDIQRHHAVIAGTGRAGTSFLVQFLDRCGLETNLDKSSWFPQARAGHEHALDSDAELPYVVKDPVLFTYCDDLDLTEISIDSLIVPVRDLMLAARSRVHQERLAIVDNPWLRRRNAQHAGMTPGGVLYSLDILDQARMLAVGFHKLLHWAITNEIPLLLPEFPRLVEDQDYALRTLWPWLGQHCSIETAQKAYTETADVNAVRIRANDVADNDLLSPRAGASDAAALERAALVERLEEATAELRLERANTERLRDEASQTQRELQCLRNRGT